VSKPFGFGTAVRGAVFRPSIGRPLLSDPGIRETPVNAVVGSTAAGDAAPSASFKSIAAFWDEAII
jgi:hypothetical protein